MENIVINALITLVVFIVVCGGIIALDIHSEKKVHHATE